MVQTLFDIDQPLAKRTTMAYNLQPSQQLVNIRSVLASRKRKSNVVSSSSSVCIPVDSKDDVGKKQEQAYDDLYSGLPSPPVETSLDDFPTMSSKNKSNHSPPLTPNTVFSSCSSVTTETRGNNDNNSSPMEETEDALLSTKDIESKLAALREEKHNMFQLLKRLVEQEEQQQKCSAEKVEQRRQPLGLQCMDQQQEQPDLKKKKTSRWSSPVVSPSSYQRPSPLSQYQVSISTAPSRHTPASASATASSFHTHAGHHMYLGGQQQSTLYRPQQPPYLY